jgi:amino acid transporter
MAQQVDIREEVDIVRIDTLFLEKQRNRQASRAIAFLVILNGIAALLLLADFLRLHPSIENAPKVADAMVVFGAGVVAALASLFFAYLRLTIRIEAPERAPLRPVVWWLAMLAAVASAVCFVAGLRMVGTAVAPTLVSSAELAKTPHRGEAGPPDQVLPAQKGLLVQMGLPVEMGLRAQQDFPVQQGFPVQQLHPTPRSCEFKAWPHLRSWRVSRERD